MVITGEDIIPEFSTAHHHPHPPAAEAEARAGINIERLLRRGGKTSERRN